MRTILGAKANVGNYGNGSVHFDHLRVHLLPTPEFHQSPRQTLHRSRPGDQPPRIQLLVGHRRIPTSASTDMACRRAQRPQPTPHGQRRHPHPGLAEDQAKARRHPRTPSEPHADPGLAEDDGDHPRGPRMTRTTHSARYGPAKVTNFT